MLVGLPADQLLWDGLDCRRRAKERRWHQLHPGRGLVNAGNGNGNGVGIIMNDYGLDHETENSRSVAHQ